MALFQLAPIPNYIHHFPYRQLIIVKGVIILCAIFQCILWWDHKQSLEPEFYEPSLSTSTTTPAPTSASEASPAMKTTSAGMAKPTHPLLHLKPPHKAQIHKASSKLVTKSSLYKPSSASSSAERNLHHHRSSRWAPIFNLLALLFTAISAWFMLQKFFWMRLDIALMVASSLFTSLALLSSFHFYVVGAQVLGLLFALLNSLMLFLQSTSMLLTVRHAKNCVSNLFIKDWGAAEFSYMEVRELESDF